jgi:hypothetical protein
MADIFISYSKADHALALKLSAFLEAEGWSVWWDKSLAPADLYRDEIMKQLAAARAVITIWTPNSVKSDWVRAEAGRAKADRKLIPVKTSDVAYTDIPLPFGEMHTENIESSELIRAAVVAQLAKPAVEPTAWVSLTKGFKYELLTWAGIVGGALTLFGHMSDLLKIADWARVLVENWKAWTHAFWVSAFSWLGIQLPPEWTPVLSFLLFGSLLTIGQAVQYRTTKTQSIAFKFESRSEIFWVALAAVGFFLLTSTAKRSSFFAKLTIMLPSSVAEQVLSYIGYGLVALIITLGFLVRGAEQKLHAAVAVSLMAIFWIIITLNNLMAMRDSKGFAYFTAVAMIIVLPVILLSVAPAKAVSRRLIFLALGLILLIALNELSKLGLDVSAPKLHG